MARRIDARPGGASGRKRYRPSSLRPAGIRTQRYPEGDPNDRGETIDVTLARREALSDALDAEDRRSAEIEPDDSRIPQRKRHRGHDDLVEELRLSSRLRRAGEPRVVRGGRRGGGPAVGAAGDPVLGGDRRAPGRIPADAGGPCRGAGGGCRQGPQPGARGALRAGRGRDGPPELTRGRGSFPAGGGRVSRSGGPNWSGGGAPDGPGRRLRLVAGGSG